MKQKVLPQFKKVRIIIDNEARSKKNLEDKVLKEVSLEKSIFGLEPKDTIIHRMINYQLSKRRSGNHKTKGISEISGTTKKPLNKKERGVPVREVDALRK